LILPGLDRDRDQKKVTLQIPTLGAPSKTDISQNVSYSMERSLLALKTIFRMKKRKISR
jgi:hypothetical protein